MMASFISTYIKFFFLLTPFFLLSSFLSMTRHMEGRQRGATALKTTGAIVIVAFFLLLFGKELFDVFGITIDSFRVGTGILLFLSAIQLVQGPKNETTGEAEDHIAVVPLAIPIAVGPATTGALLVFSGEMTTLESTLIGMAGILAAIISTGLLLYLSGYIERVVGKNGLSILSKITGLILAALAAQMVMKGLKDFLST